MAVEENTPTHFTTREYREIESNMQVLSAGTALLADALYDRDPKITALQAENILNHIDKTVENLERFREAVKHLTT